MKLYISIVLMLGGGLLAIQYKRRKGIYGFAITLICLGLMVAAYF